MVTWVTDRAVIEEAKAKMESEFMSKYAAWLDDFENLSDRDYGRKYGWTKSKSFCGDCLKSVVLFQKYIWSGRWMCDWEKAGYDKKVIWQLANEKYLSHSYYSNWHARATGHTDFYYFSQVMAKQIYKAHKAKG